MREIELLKGRYARYVDLYPAEVSQLRREAIDPDDVWAKRLTHYDPHTDHLWLGDWLSCPVFGSEVYVYAPPALGGMVRLSGPDPDDARDHVILRFQDKDGDTLHVEDLTDAEAADQLSNSPRWHAQLVAHEAVASLSFLDLTQLISWAEGDAREVDPERVRELRDHFSPDPGDGADQVTL